MYNRANYLKNVLLQTVPVDWLYNIVERNYPYCIIQIIQSKTEHQNENDQGMPFGLTHFLVRM